MPRPSLAAPMGIPSLSDAASMGGMIICRHVAFPAMAENWRSCTSGCRSCQRSPIRTPRAPQAVFHAEWGWIKRSCRQAQRQARARRDRKPDLGQRRLPGGACFFARGPNPRQAGRRNARLARIIRRSSGPANRIRRVDHGHRSQNGNNPCGLTTRQGQNWRGHGSPSQPMDVSLACSALTRWFSLKQYEAAGINTGVPYFRPICRGCNFKE